MTRRRWIATGLSVVLVGALATGAMLPASAAGEVVSQPAGQLLLRTGAVDQVEYAGQVQALGKTGACDLTSTGADLLQFSGLVGSSAKKVGFLSDSIGVIESSLTQLCNKVDVISLTSVETLTLKLGSALKSFDGTPLLATRASLDLEVRSFLGSKAKVQATAKLAGATVGTFELTQGSAACPVGDNGNCQWVITAPGLEFDALALKAVKGSFSLEGGADSQTPATAATSFDLVSKVDAVLDCEAGASLSKDNASVTYVGNADGTECDPVGATLTADNDAVRFLKPGDIDPTAQFVFGIGWLRPTTAGTTAIEPTEVDWETPAAGVVVPLGWCPDPVFDGETTIDGQTLPKLVGIADPGAVADLDDAPGTQFACLGSQYATPQGAQVRILEQIYVIGDIRLQK